MRSNATWRTTRLDTVRGQGGPLQFHAQEKAKSLGDSFEFVDLFALKGARWSWECVIELPHGKGKRKAKSTRKWDCGKAQDR